MQLHKLFLLLFAAVCALAPLPLYSMFSRLSRVAMTAAAAVGATALRADKADCAIVRAETWKKEGCADITLLGDRHEIEDPEQDRAMIQSMSALTAKQKKLHVLVEDLAEAHRLGDGREFCLLPSRYLIWGLTHRLREAGVSASSIECRLGLDFALLGRITYKDAFDNYREIIQALEVANPTSPLDILKNEILEQVKKRDYPLLENPTALTNKRINNGRIGCEVVDMRAVDKACAPGGDHEHSVVVAGLMHCDDVAEVLLRKLNYVRTHCLASNDNRFITKLYEPDIPANKRDLYDVDEFDGDKAVLLAPPSPISPEQLADYFNNPDKYYDEQFRKKEIAQTAMRGVLK